MACGPVRPITILGQDKRLTLTSIDTSWINVVLAQELRNSCPFANPLVACSQYCWWFCAMRFSPYQVAWPGDNSKPQFSIACHAPMAMTICGWGVCVEASCVKSTKHANRMHIPPVVACRQPAAGANHVITLLQACTKRFVTDEVNLWTMLRLWTWPCITWLQSGAQVLHYNFCLTTDTHQHCMKTGSWCCHHLQGSKANHHGDNQSVWVSVYQSVCVCVCVCVD